MIKKVGWLKNGIARPEGIFDANGKKLKGATLTQEFCDEWNGVAAAPVAEPEPEVVEEKAPSVEVTEIEPILKPKKKKGFFKRK